MSMFRPCNLMMQVASLIMRLAQQRQETDAEKREAESALAHHLEEMQEHVANLTQRMHADQVCKRRYQH